MPFRLLHPAPLLRIAIALAAGFAFQAASSPAQDQSQSQKKAPELSDKTGEALSGLKAMIDAKNWDGALGTLSGLEATVDPSSYDMSVVLDAQAKIYYAYKNDFGKAVGLWERLLALVAQHPEYLEPSDLVEHYQFMARGYYVIGSKLKAGDPAQEEDWGHARDYMKRYLDATKKPVQDDLNFYADLLYYKATADPAHMDMPVLNDAKAEAEKALEASIKPSEQIYQMIAVIDEHQGNYTDAAKILEYLAKLKPTTKDYWEQLFGIYDNLASSIDIEKNPNQTDLRRQYFADAINTIERAQGHGFLNTPAYYFNLVVMYQDVDQYGMATDLLQQGLKDGKIDNTIANWEFLSAFYMQVGKSLQAVDALKDAEAAYPDNYALDGQIAQIYYEMDNTQQTYAFSKAATAKIERAQAKGDFKPDPQYKPYQAYELLSYMAFEQGKYQEALDACEKGMTFPGAAKDLGNLRQNIKGAIKQQELEKAAAEGSTSG